MDGFPEIVHTVLFVVDYLDEEEPVSEVEFDVCRMQLFEFLNAFLDLVVASRDFHPKDLQLRCIKLFLEEFLPKGDCSMGSQSLIKLKLLHFTITPARHVLV